MDFHGRFYVGRNANLAIVGDLSIDEAKQYAEQLTRYLKPGESAQPVADPRPIRQAKTVTIPFETSQTHIKQGMPVLSRKDPDYYALYVGNHVLGGSGFSSRLMQEIREEDNHKSPAKGRGNARSEREDDWASDFPFRTVSTEHGAVRTTCSATIPRTS